MNVSYCGKSSPLHTAVVLKQAGKSDLDDRIKNLSLSEPDPAAPPEVTSKKVVTLSSDERLKALISIKTEECTATDAVFAWLENSIVPTVSNCADLIKDSAIHELDALRTKCEQFIQNQFFNAVKLTYSDDNTFVLTLSDAVMREQQRMSCTISLRLLINALSKKTGVAVVSTKNLDNEGVIQLFEMLSPLLPVISSLSLRNSIETHYSFHVVVPYLVRCSQLKHLLLSGYTGFSVQEIAGVASQLPHLVALDTINMPSITDITSITNLQRLTKLALRGCIQLDVNQVVSTLSSMTAIKEVDLRGLSVSLPSLLRLLSCVPTLETVHVHAGHEVPETVVQSLSQPVSVNRHVVIDMSKTLSLDALKIIFMRCPRLTGIVVKNCQTIEDLQRMLDAIPDKSKIIQFQIASCTFDTVHALGSIDAQLPQITKLLLRGRLSGAMMTQVQLGFKNLLELSIGTCSADDEVSDDPITDYQLKAFHPQLSYFALMKLSHVTSSGLCTFIANHSNLKVLRVIGCPQITEMQLERLHELHGDLQINPTPVRRG